MKRILLLSSILILAITVSAQSISVSSFKLLESDLTANTAGTTERDLNGEVAALIKVVTTQTGFVFDGGSLGIVKTKQTPGEVWVYIPHGAKKITIKHPQLGVLRDYYFPVSIEKARTYEMVLVSGTVQTIVNQSSNNQYLVLKVTPANAVVELNNEILPTTDGIAQKFVKLGSYEYRVQAKDYHTVAGIVNVDDPNNKKMLEINLAPAFGWIEIPANSEYNGAQVYIDNALAGTIPMKSQKMPSGEHDVKIVKALYNPYSQKVLVKDNETSQITPTLSANFSEVTISVDNDADIYINGELKAKGSWTGKLESGSYLIEAQKENHRSTSQNVDISAVNGKQTIQLSTPIPIYGKANITSTPAMAYVYLDGKNMGHTPLFLPQLLIGKHDITIQKEGYSTYETTISINEQESLDIIAKLENKVETVFYISPIAGRLSIDDQFIGEDSMIIATLPVGKHMINIMPTVQNQDNYKSYSSIVDVRNRYSVIETILEKNVTNILVTFDDLDKHTDKPTYIKVNGSGFIPYSGLVFDIKLPLGNNNIVVRHEGYKELENKIEIDSKIKNIRINFKKKSISTVANTISNQRDKELKQRVFDIDKSVGNLHLNKIVITNGHTTSFFNYINNAKVNDGSNRTWIRIDPRTFISNTKDNKLYRMLGACGISIAPNKTYLEPNENRIFALSFPPLPDDADIIHLIESFDSSWQFPFISLKGNNEQSKQLVLINKEKEEMPSFPGGQSAMFKWLSNNIIYPQECEKDGLQGRVVLTYVVERDGSISEVKVENSVHPLLDAEAIRVTKAMPRWIPGKINGIPVRVKYTLPITFVSNRNL